MQVRMFSVGLALVIGCGSMTAIRGVEHDQAAQAARHADDEAADQLQLARELPGSPPDVVAAFVDLLAEGGPVAGHEACMLFTSQAADQFSAANHAPTCGAAMQDLHSLISDPGTYVNDLSVPATVWVESAGTATVNGCAVNWSGPWSDTPSSAPGPLPGQWALVQLDGQGWQIARYEPC